MIILQNFLKRLILFIFYFDLGFTYFIKITLYRNFMRLKLYLLTKNKLIKFYNNLKLFESHIFLFLYYYFLELLNTIFFIFKYFQVNFLLKLRQDVLKAPALEIYYPLRTSIFSVTLRITGVFLTLGLGLFFLIYLFIIF
jgi:hypothetical protein